MPIDSQRYPDIKRAYERDKDTPDFGRAGGVPVDDIYERRFRKLSNRLGGSRHPWAGGRY